MSGFWQNYIEFLSISISQYTGQRNTTVSKEKDKMKEIKITSYIYTIHARRVRLECTYTIPSTTYYYSRVLCVSPWGET